MKKETSRIMVGALAFLAGAILVEAVATWYLGKWEDLSVFLLRAIVMTSMIAVGVIPILALVVVAAALFLLIAAVRTPRLWWLSLISYTLLATYWLSCFFWMGIEYPLRW
jgi:hypothetical protein